MAARPTRPAMELLPAMLLPNLPRLTVDDGQVCNCAMAWTRKLWDFQGSCASLEGTLSSSINSRLSSSGESWILTTPHHRTHLSCQRPLFTQLSSHCTCQPHLSYVPVARTIARQTTAVSFTTALSPDSLLIPFSHHHTDCTCCTHHRQISQTST